MQFNDEQLQVRDLIRRVAREKVAPRANEIDRTADYPHDMYALLKDLGLFTLPFPAEYGGMNSMVAACLAIEEFGRVCYNTAYLLLVQWLPFGAILAGGDEEQKQRFLPGLANGTRRGAFASTESQSGSDVAGITTRVRRAEGGWRLKGAKIWCTNAPQADFILVVARVGEPDEPSHIGLFIVEAGSAGLEIGRKENKSGARGVPSGPLVFTDVFVRTADRVGDEALRREDGRVPRQGRKDAHAQGWLERAERAARADERAAGLRDGCVDQYDPQPELGSVAGDRHAARLQQTVMAAKRSHQPPLSSGAVGGMNRVRSVVSSEQAWLPVEKT